MKTRNLPRHLPFYVVLCGLLIASVVLTSATQAQNGVANRGVSKRMSMMSDATTAVETLVNMTAGRVRFDRVQARAARRNLIKITRSIPSAFRKPDSDPLSRARPEIWLRWNDFETHADTARRAARRLQVDRLESLRLTLPDVIKSCLSCHQVYRNPR
jgi:cytochrome c556